MKMKLMILPLIIFFFSCNGKKNASGEIISKTKMQAVLWDIIRADSFTQQFIKKDSTKNPVFENARLQQQIFLNHKITREDFEKSYSYYKEHPDLMRPLLDSITAIAERQRNVMMKNKYSITH